MNASTTRLPLPRSDMIERLSNATITRGLIDRPDRSHCGAVYDSAGRLAKGSLRTPDGKYRPRDPELLADALAGRTVRRRLPRALYLGHAFTHFGHFLLETVSALGWVGMTDPETPLLFHSFDERGENVFTRPGFGLECLALLGIPPDRITMIGDDLLVDELLMPPRAYNFRRGPAYDFGEVYRTLRAAALRSPRGTPAKHIYLSRSRWKPRLRARLANEAAIERRVSARGFAVLHPERMSLADQIRAAAGAEIVAGVDGSALHLSAFMSPGTRMLVLQTSRRHTILRLNALVGVQTIALPAATSAESAGALAVDPGRLDEALDRLGCPPASGAVRRLIDRLFR